MLFSAMERQAGSTEHRATSRAGLPVGLAQMSTTVDAPFRSIIAARISGCVFNVGNFDNPTLHHWPLSLSRVRRSRRGWRFLAFIIFLYLRLRNRILKTYFFA